jgi:hypothetical protein
VARKARSLDEAWAFGLAGSKSYSVENVLWVEKHAQIPVLI